VTTRREVVLALGASALAFPLRSPAQAPGKVWRIGLLHVGTDHVPPSYPAFREGMRALGYEEGRNIQYDFRNVDDDKAALEAARALVRSSVDMVVAFDTEACSAAHSAVKAIPVVFMHAVNPVAYGYVASLARPGGNITGFAGIPELPGKELQILKEIKPRLARLLLLVDPADPGSLRWRDEVRQVARGLGVSLVERAASTLEEVTRIFDRLGRGAAEAVIFVSPRVRHRSQRRALELSAKHNLLLVGSRRSWVEQGALFSYNYDFVKMGRLAASRYADKILKGAKPADLPIEEVTEYELIVNRGTALRHGLTLPDAILLRASEVIG
jgi:putative ABC transport system substrate-binding protein